MTRILLGIDGGGTKTIGRVLAVEEHAQSHNAEQELQMARVLAEHKVGPCALTNDLDGSCKNMAELIEVIAEKANVKIEDMIIAAGLSGAGSRTLSQSLSNYLMARLPINAEQIVITTDAQTSVLGAGFGEPLVCVALGTGSVAMRLDKNGRLHQVGGWGFSIGDEGGAAVLGKLAVRKVLWEFDEVELNNRPESKLAIEIKKKIGTDREDVLAWLRKANANGFGALAPIVSELADDCPAALTVLHQHAEDVEQLIASTLQDNPLDVVVIGGLADATVPYLSPELRTKIIPAKGNSLDGACFVALTHLRELLASQQPANQDAYSTPEGNQESQFEHETRLLKQLESMLSESRNPASVNIDQVSTQHLLSIINQEDHKVPQAVSKVLPQIAQTVDMVVEAFNKKGRLIYLGAGTSGRLGILDAVECPPTFSVDDDMVIGLIAGGDGAIYKAVEGAEDKPEFAVDDLKAISFGPNDVLVGIAASGRTPYVLGGLEYARSLGAKTAAVTCNPGALVMEVADVGICAEVGPEVLTGSTRMKSGTAQKLILNMITTASMVRIGKCYQNLMVDVYASNEKLVARASRIVMQATGCSHEEAKLALEKADYSAKLAILMVLTQVSAPEGQKQLAKHAGRLRAAMQEMRVVA